MSTKRPNEDSTTNRVLGIVGFVLSLVPVITVAGFVLSIVAIVRSRKDNRPNGFARAGVIIGGLGSLATLIIVAIIIVSAISLLQTCGELGLGVHEVGNATYTCTPTSSYVSYA